MMEEEKRLPKSCLLTPEYVQTHGYTPWEHTPGCLLGAMLKRCHQCDTRSLRRWQCCKMPLLTLLATASGSSGKRKKKNALQKLCNTSGKLQV